MVFPVVGGTQSTGYDIANSGLFNGSNQLLSRTPSSEESDMTKWTVSAWVKRGNLGDGSNHQYFFGAGDYTILGFNSSDNIYLQVYNSSGGAKAVQTTAKYQDPTAWYNIVGKYDSTQGTAANRLKLYVNGEEVTSFGVDQRSSITQNHADLVGDDVAHTIGYSANNTSYFDGYMADVNVICGNTYDASYFGERDTDSGIWKPKKFGGSYGSNGSFHEFGAESTGVGAGRFASDTSGNGNHYDTSNFSSEYQHTDTPTNNFAVLNPLFSGRSSTLSKGNLQVTGETDNTYDVATFGSSMKWYTEWDLDEDYDGSGGGVRFGALHEDELAVNDNFGNFGNATAKWYTNSNDGKYQEGPGNNPSGGGSRTRPGNNDIIMVACDGANAKIYFGINGTWLDSGDPANGTGGFHGNWTTAMKAGIWFPAVVYSLTVASGHINFGNPMKSIDSGNADDNGYGEFEYDVPAGYYALCTKNLAEYG